MADNTSDNTLPDIVYKDHWFVAYWRPTMAYIYAIICFCDFVVFPFFSMWMPIFYKHFMDQVIAYTPWVPVSLSNGGYIHFVFAAVLGISAYTRGQEKVARINAMTQINGTSGN